MKTLLGMLSDTDYTKVRKLLIDIMLKGDIDNNEKKNQLQNSFQSKYKLTINDPEIKELVVQPGDTCFEKLDKNVKIRSFPGNVKIYEIFKM